MDRVGDILHFEKEMLTPQMTVKTAIVIFEEAESDALVVVDFEGRATSSGSSPSSMLCAATLRNLTADDAELAGE